jgi:hypothetical protein
MSRILTGNIWSQLKNEYKKSTRKTAAIAYVSSDDYILFTKGDILICDASDHAISCGETSTKTLERFYKDGAIIYSCAGLHAKTIVFDDTTAVIGSSNLSRSSADMLYELALLTTDRITISKTLAFIHNLKQHSQLINIKFLSRIKKIPVSKRHYKLKRRKPEPIGNRAWIISTHLLNNKKYKNEQLYEEKAEQDIKNNIEMSSAEISNIRWHGSGRFRKLAKQGDVIIELFSSGKQVRVYPPVAILYRQDHGEWTRFYYIESDNPISWSKFERHLHKGGIRHIRKRSTKGLDRRTVSLISAFWE